MNNNGEIQQVMKIRKHFTFYGRVQNVGFRFLAHHFAVINHCTGWVRNEPDGSVEMELQGEKAAINAVISSLDDDRYIRIESFEDEIIPVIDHESKFRYF